MDRDMEPKFQVGDIIGTHGCLKRNVKWINKRLRLYGLGFIHNVSSMPQVSGDDYTWRFDSCHHTYDLVVPDHIPVSQHDNYRKLKYNGRY